MVLLVGMVSVLWLIFIIRLKVMVTIHPIPRLIQQKINVLVDGLSRCTDVSGLRPGLLAGQQYNEAGVAEVDRHGNLLKFTPAVSLVETNPNTLEITGIRVIKYPPDYSAYTGGNQKNQLQIFRYADVLLMVAEAKLRSGDAPGALILSINQELHAVLLQWHLLL